MVEKTNLLKRKSGQSSSAPQDNTLRPKSPRLLPNLIRLDDDGDLEIEVIEAKSQQEARYLVNRACLSLSSPVFRAMFGKQSQFREGLFPQSPEQATVIRLEEESINAMDIFLNMTHLKGQALPVSLSYAQLYDLAILCDKYDLRKVLGHWPRIWSDEISGRSSNPAGQEWLYIQSIFGFKDLFSKTSRGIILDSTLRHDGSLLIKGNKKLDRRLSCFVLDQLRQKREHLMKTLEGFILGQHSGLLKSVIQCSCGPKNVQDFCCRLQIGHLERLFGNLESPAARQAFHSKFSPLKVVTTVESDPIDFDEMLFSRYFREKHRNCDVYAAFQKVFSTEVDAFKGVELPD